MSKVSIFAFYSYVQELMVEFFNAKMQECGLCTASGRPVITAQIDMEKNYAFLEVCFFTSNLPQVYYFSPPNARNFH